MLSAVEGRVLGSLLEKERTVPDQYPMSLHALMVACNQATNRDPVLALSEPEVDQAVTSLKAHGLARLVHPTHGRGVTKYRQVLVEKLLLGKDDAAVLTLLLLRGPQTPGELRNRSERLHRFETPAEVEQVLHRLAERGEPLVRKLERQPGQKEARWQQLLADEQAGSASETMGAEAPMTVVGLPQRLAELEDRVNRLERLVVDLVNDLTGAPPDDSAGG